jgi:CDP-diacylglycerol--glycerol-3-phosphate 3-phosphatidyltransferase
MSRRKTSIHQSDFYLIPNLLTVSRVVAIPAIVILLYYEWNWWATLTFVLVGVSDGVDGYIARKYQYESKLGMLLDPLADKLIVVSTMIMLLWQGRLDLTWGDWPTALVGPLLVIVTVGREIAITGLRGIASSIGLMMPADRGGKIKTVIQFIAISFLLAEWGALLWWGQILLAISVVAALWSGLRYILYFIKKLPA